MNEREKAEVEHRREDSAFSLSDMGSPIFSSDEIKEVVFSAGSACLVILETKESDRLEKVTLEASYPLAVKFFGKTVGSIPAPAVQNVGLTRGLVYFELIGEVEPVLKKELAKYGIPTESKDLLPLGR